MSTRVDFRTKLEEFHHKRVVTAAVDELNGEAAVNESFEAGREAVQLWEDNKELFADLKISLAELLPYDLELPPRMVNTGDILRPVPVPFPRDADYGQLAYTNDHIPKDSFTRFMEWLRTW